MHCATLSADGLVYVCDRVNDRIQVFQRDGTFLDEVLIAPRTLDFGSAFDIDFSPDPEQRYLYNIDGMNQKVWIISREDLSIVDSFGFGGTPGGRLHRGPQPGRRFRRQHLRGRDARRQAGPALRPAIGTMDGSSGVTAAMPAQPAAGRCEEEHRP